MRKIMQQWALASVLLVGTTLGAGAAQGDQANVAQVDRVDPWHCVAGIIGVDHEVTPIPGLNLAMTTEGGPVQFTVNMSVQGTPLLGRLHVFLQPVLDGVSQSTDALEWEPGNLQHTEILLYQRVYQVAAGAHTFSMEMNCLQAACIPRDFEPCEDRTGEAVVGRGWLTV